MQASNYREAKRALFDATKRRKAVLELEVFRQIEEKQADSKLFWSRAKRITGRMRAGIKPPPMVMDDDGKVEADPIRVLRIWRKFSLDIAKGTPAEEGIYDEEHRQEVEDRLKLLKALDIFQGGA